MSAQLRTTGTYSYALNMVWSPRLSAEIRLCNRWLDRVSSMVIHRNSRWARAVSGFIQCAFKARASLVHSPPLWSSNRGAVLGPKHIFFLCTADSAAGSRVGCGFCAELAGRRNCFQRLGKRGLHLAVRFLWRAGALRC